MAEAGQTEDDYRTKLLECDAADIQNLASSLLAKGNVVDALNKHAVAERAVTDLMAVQKLASKMIDGDFDFHLRPKSDTPPFQLSVESGKKFLLALADVLKDTIDHLNQDLPIAFVENLKYPDDLKNAVADAGTALDLSVHKHHDDV